MSEMSRREFGKIAMVAGAGLMGLRGSWAGGAVGGERPIYRFPFVGDLHFDKMEHHDWDKIRRERPGEEEWIRGYSESTAKYLPALLGEVAEAVRVSPVPVPFVVQVGDLVQGWCGDLRRTEVHLGEAIAMVEGAKLGRPVLMTKGNHDIAGPGGREGFDGVLLPWIARQSPGEVRSSNYVVHHQSDLFVFFDCYKPDLDWLERTLGGGKWRHVFVVVHQPVVPYYGRKPDVCFQSEAMAGQRRRFLALLGAHRAIVLSGHIHKYCALERKVGTGRFTQLAVCSIPRRLPESAANHRRGAEAYLDEMKRFGSATQPSGDLWTPKLNLGEVPLVERFQSADLQGYAMVNVFAARVETEIYLAAVKEPWNSHAMSAG
jgi:hypothetical protein